MKIPDNLKENLRWFHERGIEISPMDLERIVNTKIEDMNETDTDTLDGIRKVIMSDLEEELLREIYGN